MLIYETFTQGNETVGKPSRPDFLLRTGELLEVCSGLRIVAFEEGFHADPDGRSPRFVQRITAVRETGRAVPLSDTQKALTTDTPRYALL